MAFPPKKDDVFDDPSSSQPKGDSAAPGGQSGSNEPKGDGRTLDNIRGEFVRKQEKLEGQIASLQQAVEKLAGAVVQSAQPRPTQPPAQPQPRPIVSPYGAPGPDLNEYTEEQLQQVLASGQLNQYQARIIESHLQERRLDRKTKELFDARDKQQLIASARAEATEAAKQAFPALRDPNSEFSQRVATALKQQRDRFGDFPMDEFDVANRVARMMGVEASRAIAPGYIGKPDGGDKPAEPVDEPLMTDDEYAQIAHNLRYALPLRRNPETGRMERKKFNLQRIKERSKQYQENAQFYKQGRKVRGSNQ